MAAVMPAKYESVNSELLTLTYGAIVAQIIRDYEEPREINFQLEQMGYNIGIRIVDEFCAKNKAAKCRTFKETMETVGKDAFKMFLGLPAIVEGWNAEGTICTLRLTDNPLADFVELPPAYSELRYSNILAGVVRGALEMVSVRVDCRFTKDILNGDDATEMRVTLKEVLADAAGKDYKDD